MDKTPYNIISDEVCKTFRTFYKTLKQPFTVTVKDYKTQRSLEQNAYWHMVVGKIAQEAGYNNSDMKYLIKKAYLGMETFTDKKGVTHEREIETSMLCVKDMSDLIEKTVATATGFYNIKLEPPSHYGYGFEVNNKGE